MPKEEKRIFAPKPQYLLQKRVKSVSSGVIHQELICFTLNLLSSVRSESLAEDPRSDDRDSLSTLMPNFFSLR